MNGTYIKIMSDGSQLFVEDTECFLAIGPNSDKYVRPTLEQFATLVELDCGDILGEQIIKYDSHAACRNLPIGSHVWELEWCECTEFYFIRCGQSKEVDYQGNEIV